MKEISFSYLTTQDIESAESMLRLGTHALTVISDHYVLTSHVGIPDKHDCPIHEIPFKDIKSSTDERVKRTYQRFVDYYSSDVCDMIFIKDEDFIEDKIYRTILFAMDKVYNCDELTIKFSLSNTDSSIPEIVYTTIQKNFRILNSMRKGSDVLIVCKRKKER